MARIGYVGLGVMGGGVARRLLVGRSRGDRLQPHPQQGRAADRRRHALRRVAARGRRAADVDLLDGDEHAGAHGRHRTGPTGSSPGSGPARSTST